MNKLFYFILFTTILIFPSMTYADGPYLNIPPTNAFDKIHTDNGTVNAANFSMPIIIQGGTNISVKSSNATHTITITNTMLPGTGTGTYNTTQANNVNINTGGAKINFINGTNNPVHVVNSPIHNQVNITISDTSGSTTQGTYNRTYANNALINSGGFKFNFINGSGATVNVKNSDTGQKVNVTISATGTAGVSLLNAFSGKVNITGALGNVTITNSSGTIQINTGNDIPHLTKANNFTVQQIINLATTGVPIRGANDGLAIMGDSVDAHNGLQLYSYGATPAIRGLRANGLQGTPTATNTDDRMAQIGASGYQTTSNAFTAIVGAVRINAAEPFTGTNQGTYIAFYTTPTAGAGVISEWLRINPYGGFRIVGIADPASPTNGDFWSSTTTANTFKYQTNSKVYSIQPQLKYNYTSSGNSTGTNSNTPVMLGKYVTLIPQYSTNASITVTGYVYNSIATDGCKIQIRQNNAFMGVNGGTLAGSQIGNTVQIVSPTAQANETLSKTVVTTSLTAGTKYYFDIGFGRSGGGYCKIQNLDWYVAER